MSERLEIIGKDTYEEVFQIDVISATVDPEVKEFKCICCENGLVTYGKGSLVSSNGVRTIKVNSVEAYRCDSCDFVAHLEPIETELRQAIEKLETEA